MMCNKPSDFRGKASKIEDFKQKHNINVCLMPLSLGAEGLDLIAANNIFLLEPLLNPALEIQALNRADRLGQSRTTRVFKYVTRDTVEEKIHAFSERTKAGTSTGSESRSRCDTYVLSPTKIVMGAKEQEHVDEAALRVLLL